MTVINQQYVTFITSIYVSMIFLVFHACPHAHLCARTHTHTHTQNSFYIILGQYTGISCVWKKNSKCVKISFKTSQGSFNSKTLLWKEPCH